MLCILCRLGVHLKSILGNVERLHDWTYPKITRLGLLEGLLSSHAWNRFLNFDAYRKKLFNFFVKKQVRMLLLSFF